MYPMYPMWRYIPCSSRVDGEDTGVRTAFGIRVLDEDGHEVALYPDVSSDEATVVALCARCTNGNLSPVHLPDIIEDALYTPCNGR